MYKNTEKDNLKMLEQIDIDRREWSKARREELYKKKYLSEIVEEEKPEFGNNNLILAPVGSGKSHLIEKILIPKDFTGKVLYLTSNTALKDSLCPDDNDKRKRLAKDGESLGFYTTQNKNRFGNVPYSVHVMNYHEFGGRVKPPYQTFTDEFDLIFCDEIHSLPKYLTYDKSLELGMALYWLLREHEDKVIYYFTATQESIEKLESKTPGYLTRVKTFNYLDHPDIRKYVANSTYFINHIDQLRPHLKARLEAFNYYGYKGLAFTRMITEQEKLYEIALNEGFKPIVLWSINNERKMDKEQLRVRDFILDTGLIPKEYNFLIINGAMQEGWNLYDDMVTLAVIDTLDITEQVQSLGRIRNDIDIVIKKTKDNLDPANEYGIEVPDYYLNVPLTAANKRSLCEELYILDDRGVLKKWPTVKNYLLKSGYEIEDKFAQIDKERTRVSVITIKDVKAEETK